MTNESDVVDASLLLEQGMVDIGDDDEPDQTAVYEVGYHLLPTLSEEGVVAEVEKITNALKEAKADFVGERFPAKMGLAYPITKKIDDKKMRFDSAYFGWVAFEIVKTELAAIQSAFFGNPAILRYLIVKTDREAIAAAMTGAVAAPGDIGKPKREEEGGGEVSDKALDEALQTMQEEDAKVSE